MSIDDYKIAIATNGFNEFPYSIGAETLLLDSFVQYDKAELDLKIHLTTVILNRNFSSADGTMILTDQFWLIANFLQDYDQDLLKPWLTDTIKEAMGMTIAINADSKNKIGTAFMFGIIEFYIKHLLGWRPLTANFFDDSFHKEYRDMSIGSALNKLKKQQSLLSVFLNRIDKTSSKRLKEVGIEEKDWIKPKIADRLSLYRNTIVHGENHNNSSIGPYLCVLYILFHLCDLKKMAN